MNPDEILAKLNEQENRAEDLAWQLDRARSAQSRSRRWHTRAAPR